MVRQESSLTEFAFILQDGSTQGRRTARSTLVRAHVMDRYHRERKAKKHPKETGNERIAEHHFVTTSQNLQWQEVKGIEKKVIKEEARKTPTKPQIFPATKTLKQINHSTPSSLIKPKVPNQDMQLQTFDRLSLKDPIRGYSTHFLQIVDTCKRYLLSQSTTLRQSST
jgi:hypothetical protein